LVEISPFTITGIVPTLSASTLVNGVKRFAVLVDWSVFTVALLSCFLSNLVIFSSYQCSLIINSWITINPYMPEVEFF
jgi:hypothetical protein